jgi:hypothetical protein
MKGITKFCVAGASIGSLLLGFAACEQEVVSSGEKTPVRFSIGNIQTWSADAPTRSATEQPRIVETVAVPMEDNSFLNVSLREEAALPTRAENDLANGTVIRIVARKDDGTVTEESHTYASGGLSDNRIDLSGDYTFTAYAYNGLSTLPVTAASDPDVTLTPYNAASGNDLLIGSASASIGGSAPVLVTFALAHGFTRVLYDVATPDPSVTFAGNVSLVTNYEAALTKATGALAKASETALQPLSRTDYQIVYTGDANPVKVKIDGTVTGPGSSRSFSDIYATFKTPLNTGRSYTLQIEFKTGLTLAGSNVYWVTDDDPSSPETEGYLTFAPAGTVSRQYYQGVFFKWGSLVGISPAQDILGDNAFYPEQTPIYVPILDPGKNYKPGRWIKTTVAEAFGNGATYADIPYVDRKSTSSDAANSYLTDDYTGNDVSGGYEPSARKGDICKYLTGLPHTPDGVWRMPTSQDLRDVIGNGGIMTPLIGAKWLDVTASDSFGYPGGDYLSTVAPGVSYGGGVTMLPANGGRDASDNGALGGPSFTITAQPFCNFAYSWTSGAVPPNTSAFMQGFTGSTASTHILSTIFPRGDALGVRCVLD